MYEGKGNVPLSVCDVDSLPKLWLPFHDGGQATAKQPLSRLNPNRQMWCTRSREVAIYMHSIEHETLFCANWESLCSIPYALRIHHFIIVSAKILWIFVGLSFINHHQIIVLKSNAVGMRWLLCTRTADIKNFPKRDLICRRRAKNCY